MSDARDEVYEEVFGEPEEVDPGEAGVAPAIDVLRYPRTFEGAPFDLWVTSGMSDAPMVDATGRRYRRELIFYAAPEPDYSFALRTVAEFPFEDKTFVDEQHSIASLGMFFFEGGAEAMTRPGGSVPLPHVLLLGPLLKSHRNFGERLSIDGDPVNLLWVVPISDAEYALKKEKGADAVLDLFAENRHPWIFSPSRRSYL